MRRARGMTLLEVLIATTILASLTVIVSTLWAQTKQWTEETTTHDSALRLQRALDLLDHQWESRLIDVKLADGETGIVLVDGTHLEFITTRGVLFPDWPIVKVAYIAQQTTNPNPAEESWALRYEETRLGTASSTVGEITDESTLRRSTLVELTQRPSWSVALTDAQISEWESARGISPAQGATPDGQRWINLTDGADRRWAGLEDATNPEAVRLDGATTQGGFRWALVGQPLR